MKIDSASAIIRFHERHVEETGLLHDRRNQDAPDERERASGSGVPRRAFAGRGGTRHAACTADADIGRRCLELRVTDENVTWRVMCGVDPDAVLVIHSFSKKTQATPKSVIDLCKKRLALYDATK